MHNCMIAVLFYPIWVFKDLLWDFIQYEFLFLLFWFVELFYLYFGRSSLSCSSAIITLHSYLEVNRHIGREYFCALLV